jgi:uncharacterized protein (TIGR03792 family)
MTVVEFLTFDVAPDERADWLAIEERHWSRFLERQTGFEGKQIWQNPDDPAKVHAVIWWESTAHWKAIPHEELAAVAEAMGEHERSPVLTTFEVVRNC